MLKRDVCDWNFVVFLPSKVICTFVKQNQLESFYSRYVILFTNTVLGAQRTWEGRVNNLPAVPWSFAFDRRTFLCCLMIRLAEKAQRSAQRSAHVQQNSTKACLCFFLMLHSQRMSTMILSLDKGEAFYYKINGAALSTDLVKCGVALPSPASQHRRCPLLCGQWLSVPLVRSLNQPKETLRLDLRVSPVMLRPCLYTGCSEETHRSAGQIKHSCYTTHHLNVQHGGRRSASHVTGRNFQTVVAGKELSVS